MALVVLLLVAILGPSTSHQDGANPHRGLIPIVKPHLAPDREPLLLIEPPSELIEVKGTVVSASSTLPLAIAS